MYSNPPQTAILGYRIKNKAFRSHAKLNPSFKSVPHQRQSATPLPPYTMIRPQGMWHVLSCMFGKSRSLSSRVNNLGSTITPRKFFNLQSSEARHRNKI